jgi:acetyl esterase/lipase
MRVAAGYVRVTYRSKFSSEAAGRRALARAKGSSVPPRRLARRLDVSRSREHGFDVWRVAPRGPGPEPGDVVVYLHGGAYSSEIVSRHWSLIGHLAARTGLAVHAPIYGLAPQHHGLEALEFVSRVVTDLISDGRRCYLAGDSAGGGLALLTAQAVRAGVAGLTLLAPWLDLSLSNPGIDEVEPRDPWLRRPGLRVMAAAWARDLPLTDPRLSPIFGDLTGLPPTQVLVGTRDITLPDCRMLRDRFPGGDRLTYHEEPGALHVYPLLLPAPEARSGRDAIVAHLRASL